MLNIILFFSIIQDAERMWINDSMYEAIILLKDAYIKKHDDRFLLTMGDIYLYGLFEPQNALQIYNHSRDKSSPWLTYRIAQAYDKMNRFKKASSLYNFIITKHRKDTLLTSYALHAIERCFYKNFPDTAALIGTFPITQIEIEKIYNEYHKNPNDTTGVSKKEILNSMLFAYTVRKYVIDTLFKTYTKPVYFLDDTLLTTFKIKPNHILKDAELYALSPAMQYLYKQLIIIPATPTDKEIKKYYKTHEDEFIRDERYFLKEAIVSDSTNAYSLLNKITTKTYDFDKLQYDSTVKWVMPGWRRLIDLPDTMLTTIYKMDTGEVTIIPYNKTYHLIRLQKKTKKYKYSLKEAYESIKFKIGKKRADSLYNIVVKRLKQSIPIDSTEEGIIIYGSLLTNNDILDIIKKQHLRGMPGEKQINSVIENQILFKSLKYYIYSKNLYLNDSLWEEYDNVLFSKLNDWAYNLFVKDSSIIPNKILDTYYKKHKKDYYIYPRAKVREILVKTKNSANTIKKLLKKESFDSLAYRYSILPSKRRRGLVGYVDIGKHDYKYDIYIKKKKGISGPIKTEDGYLFLKVVDFKKGYFMSYAEARPDIIRKLKKAKADSLEQIFKKKLFKKYGVKILKEM